MPLIVSASDTASGVGIPLALAAGLVSFLSPCVLPLVPGYLSAVIGVTPTQVLLNDPWYGQRWHARSEFEASYSTFDDMAVILG